MVMNSIGKDAVAGREPVQAEPLPRRPGRRQPGGFTLIELLVTIIVLGIMAAIAVPNFNAFVANQRVKAVGQDLFMTLLYARSEAIKRNQPVIVEALGVDWSGGWRVVTSDDEQLRISQAGTSAGVEIDAGATTQVTFLRSGRVSAAVSFSACDNKSLATTRMVAVNISGHAEVRYGVKCS